MKFYKIISSYSKEVKLAPIHSKDLICSDGSVHPIYEKKQKKNQRIDNGWRPRKDLVRTNYASMMYSEKLKKFLEKKGINSNAFCEVENSNHFILDSSYLPSAKIDLENCTWKSEGTCPTCGRGFYKLWNQENDYSKLVLEYDSALKIFVAYDVPFVVFVTEMFFQELLDEGFKGLEKGDSGIFSIKEIGDK